MMTEEEIDFTDDKTIGEGIDFIDDLIRFAITCRDDPADIDYVRTSSSTAAYRYALKGFIDGLMTFIEKMSIDTFHSCGG
jgi:hypothetical protein